MKSYDIGRAIILLQPDAQFTLVGNNYDDVVWLEPLAVIPTLAEIEATIADFSTEQEPTVEEKLARTGLSLDDLKAALGL